MSTKHTYLEKAFLPAHPISGHTDVLVDTPLTGQVLQINGDGVWVNSFVDAPEIPAGSNGQFIGTVGGAVTWVTPTLFTGGDPLPYADAAAARAALEIFGTPSTDNVLQMRDGDQLIDSPVSFVFGAGTFNDRDLYNEGALYLETAVAPLTERVVLTKATNGLYVGVPTGDDIEFHYPSVYQRFSAAGAAFGGDFTPTAPVHAQSSSGAQLLFEYSSGINGSVTIDSGGHLSISHTGTRIAIGKDVTSTGDSSVAIGDTVTANAGQTVVIGFQAAALGIGGIALGYDAYSGTPYGIAMGRDSVVNGIYSIALGRGATVNGDNTLVLGSSSYPINTIFAGKGEVNATPTVFSLRGTGAIGTNIVGGGINIDVGASTGNAASSVGRLRATAAGGSGVTPQSIYNDILTWSRTEVAIAAGVYLNLAAAGAVVTSVYGVGKNGTATQVNAPTGGTVTQSINGSTMTSTASTAFTVTPALICSNTLSFSANVALDTSAYGVCRPSTNVTRIQALTGATGTVQICTGTTINASVWQAGMVVGGTGIVTPARRLEVVDTVAAQQRWTYSTGIYAEMQVDASGNPRLTATGNTIGILGQATGQYGVAVGASSTAAQDATAVGNTAEAATTGSVAVGAFAAATGALYPIAIGHNAVASTDYALAVGRNSVALAAHSTAIGLSAATTGSYATAIGRLATAGNVALALGGFAVAGTAALALGYTATAAENSVALGYFATLTGIGAVGVGYQAAVGGEAGVAIGRQASAAGSHAIALGRGASASAAYTLALGEGSSATGDYDFALGRSASAAGGGGIAIGYATTAINNTSVAIGYLASATANAAIAIGRQASCSSASSIAIGREAVCSANRSIAIGQGATCAVNAAAVLGSESYPINTIFAGKGVTSATPTGWGLRGTGGSGTNVAGGDIHLDAGPGTGTAASGTGRLRVTEATGSGATLQSSWVDRVRWNSTGLAFFGTAPAARPAAIADATDAASTITQLNLALAALRTLGLIAT